MALVTVERRKLKIDKIATTVLYGVVDIATEEFDAKSGRVEPFKNITDWQRTAASLGGLALSFMGKGHVGALGHDMFMSSTPLFEKSVLKVVRTFMGGGGRMSRSARTLRSGNSELSMSPGLISGPQTF